jgi:hypothetical protein
MTDATPLPFDLPSVERKKLTVDFTAATSRRTAACCCCGGQSASSACAGGLPMRCRIVAMRAASVTTCSEMVMARASAIACGHKDAVDFDRLRHDPLMKVAVGRCPITGAPLASQSTISRLENAPSKTEAARLSAALVAQTGTTVKPRKQEIRRCGPSSST